MTISATAAAALNAYAATAKVTGGANPAAPVPQEAQAGGFNDMVKQALEAVTEQAKASDKAAMDAVSGKADIVDVVTAVAETELALETLVSVRDRVISAYEEIMRMPI